MPKQPPTKKKLYSPEQKAKAAQLYLEEGFPASMLAQEFGVSPKTISLWVRTFRASGIEGFRKVRSVKHQESSTHDPVKAKILAHKLQHPEHGVKRIAQIFRRFLCLDVSTHKVRETLKEDGLVRVSSKAKPKNDPKPRFFERATPNQLWQTDIMTFRLAGQNAYLIGFMDDYSRYVVGLGAYRSQTAENVLETVKIAFGEYGIPREMLSDNGRQYHNWRGVTRFEKLLGTHRIKHIRSQPHHPMTCGKIERFWNTIQQEFLFKCQFDSFENFRERLGLWVKYYNFKRPNQGIGGMCPADRFFEINNELKNTLQQSIEENIQELALRGKLKKAFYMVGRMGDQNVAIRAEKGKLTMHLDDPERPEGRQLEYDLNADLVQKNIIHMEIDENDKNDEAAGGSCGSPECTGGTEADRSDKGFDTTREAASAPIAPAILRAGEMPGSVITLVDEPKRECDLPGDANSAPATGALGGAGTFGNDPGIGRQAEDLGVAGEQAPEAPRRSDHAFDVQADCPGEAPRASSGKDAGILTFAIQESNVTITI